MNKKNIILVRCLGSFLLILIFCTLFFQRDLLLSHAKEPDIKMEKGNLIFQTTDTKASANITWSTVGFLITRERCMTGLTANGGYPLKMDHGEIKLKPDWKWEKPEGTQIKVIFTIPKEAVNKALIDAGAGEIAPGDTLYFHGIHQVRHSGTPYGRPKYSLPEIKYAESWSNPNDFNDRFDRRVIFEPEGPQPIRETCLTADGKVIQKQDLENTVLGAIAEVRHEKTVEYKGKTLYLSKSYQNYGETGKRISGTTNFVTSIYAKDYEEQIGRVRLRKKMQAPGGLEFVAVYREKGTSSSPGGSGESIGEQMGAELLDPNPYGVIGADARYSEQYDVLQGIPSTETLYANVYTDDFLLGYGFQKKSGTKTYPVTVTKTYYLSWTEKESDGEGGFKEVSRSDTRAVTKNYNIKRPYSYWIINNIDYYKIARAEIRNSALPSGGITLTPSSYAVPTLNFTHFQAESSHLKPAPNKGHVSLSASLSGGSSRPSVPAQDFTGQAEAAVGRIQVQNDSLDFDGITVMNTGWRADKTEEPASIETYPEEIGEEVLYRFGMVIHKDTSNGTKSSSGTLHYERVKALNPRKGASLSYPIASLNEVLVHTPVVCDAAVSSQARYNQMLSPHKGRAALVLDRPFTLSFPTVGDHLYIDGYGYRDYERYMKSREVRFPFDVYQDKTFYQAGTWITITREYTEFYLPIWVDEGEYRIECNAASINGEANHALDRKENLANLELSNYTAVDSIQVEVSGRLYGLSLYDISDYPIWQSVFRKPDSLELTGFLYKTGIKDQNGDKTGQKPQFTFPVFKGSHPDFPNIGTVKTGYAVRFFLSSIGNMDGEKDYIRIAPRFYYVSEDGSKRVEADLYYTETVAGREQRLVKAGSDRDRQNVKVRRTGDEYLSISGEELLVKAFLEHKNVGELVLEENRLFTFTNMMIPKGLRMYTGMHHTPTGSLPASVDPVKAAKSKQKWYGEYYIPSKVYAAEKGMDVEGYAKNHRIDFKENFWLKDGYLAVLFDIETIQEGKRHLSYINGNNAKFGYCNMWKMEGFSNQKTDPSGNLFEFQDGDFVFYDLGRSAAKDYKSGGTH